MLYLFIGMVRNGKTISIVNEAKKFYDEGYTIYSNTYLSFDFILLSREMILKFEKQKLDLPQKTVFVISEISAWFSSRNSMSSNNKIFSFFISQLGKFTNDKQKGLTILADTQFFSFLDKNGRQLTYYLIECKKINEIPNEYIDVLRIWKKNVNLIFKTFRKEVVRFDKNDFDLYDTQGQVISEV
jgi:hypothetical protein